MNTRTLFGTTGIIARIGMGKMSGLVIGLLGFCILPYLWPAADFWLRFGILFWYTTFGAIIGAFGIVQTLEPVSTIAIPWWVRDVFVGAWLNFVLMLFAHDAMRELLAVMFGSQGILQSPFWFVLEGALFGLLIGYLAHRYDKR